VRTVECIAISEATTVGTAEVNYCVGGMACCHLQVDLYLRHGVTSQKIEFHATRISQGGGSCITKSFIICTLHKV
jgi:hypothetical protein